MSDIGFKDTLPFGKFKGRTVEDVMKISAEGPGWLLWLRDARKKDNGDPKFFSEDVLLALDEKIEQNKALRQNHESWGIAAIREKREKEAAALALAEKVAAERAEAQEAYSATWGAF